MAKYSTQHTSPHEVIVSALNVIQTQGGDGNFVIFEGDPARNYYIQFAGEKGSDELYAEAVANHALKPDFQLMSEKIDELRQLGWQDQGDEQNYAQTFRAKDDQERLEIAEVVWRTLSRVYDIPAGAELEIKVNLE